MTPSEKTKKPFATSAAGWLTAAMIMFAVALLWFVQGSEVTGGLALVAGVAMAVAGYAEKNKERRGSGRV